MDIYIFIKALLVSLYHSSNLSLCTEIIFFFFRKSLILEFEKNELDEVGNFSHLEKFPYDIMTFSCTALGD